MWKNFLMIFGSVFLAELGDKTQLATLLFASDAKIGRSGVFFAASLALVLSTLIAVLLGEQVAQWIPPRTLKILSGIGFVVIGFWILWMKE